MKKKRNDYMKEFLRIELDKHSYSVIVMKGFIQKESGKVKNLLNYNDLVKTRQKFK